MLFDRQVGQKGFDLRASHFSRVPLVVKEDVTLDPVDVARLGASGVMAQLKGVADLVEQFLGAVFHLDSRLGLLYTLMAPGQVSAVCPIILHFSVLYGISVVESIVGPLR